MSSNPQNKVSVWGVAIGGSLLIHFVLLGLLAMTAGGSGVEETPPPAEPTPAPAATSEDGGQGTARPTTPPTKPITPAAPTQGSAAPRATAEAATEGEVVTYVVKQGDNLTRIARACGSTVTELAELNGKPVKRLEKLWVGQKIKLPRPISE